MAKTNAVATCQPSALELFDHANFALRRAAALANLICGFDEGLESTREIKITADVIETFLCDVEEAVAGLYVHAQAVQHG